MATLGLHSKIKQFGFTTHTKRSDPYTPAMIYVVEPRLVLINYCPHTYIKILNIAGRYEGVWNSNDGIQQNCEYGAITPYFGIKGLYILEFRSDDYAGGIYYKCKARIRFI